MCNYMCVCVFHLVCSSVCFKFRVNSQSEKAEILHHLTDNFLELDLEKNFAKVNLHFLKITKYLCNSQAHKTYYD